MSSPNLFPQELLDSMAASEAASLPNGTTELFVDINRTDTYIPTGSSVWPYKTIVAAMTEANANADAAHPYLVTVLPGVYSEAPFDIEPYVKISGAGRHQTHIYASLLSAHFITMLENTRLEHCTIWGPTDPNVAGVYMATGGNPIRIGEVAFSRGYYGILCNQGTTGHIILDRVGFADEGATMNTFLRVINHSHVFMTDARLEGVDECIQIGAVVEGADARLTVVDLYHQVFGAATVGLRVNNSATLRVNGGVFMGGHTALQCGADGAPNLRVVGSIIHRALGVPSNYTHDIETQTASASVNFGGFASRDKFSVIPGTELYANFLNHETAHQGACALGELVVGDVDCVLPLLDYGKSAYLTGLVSGGEVELGAGLNVIVRAGVGYINDPALCSPLRVAWGEDLHFALTDDTPDQFIYIDNTGAIGKSTLAIDYTTNIVLAKATTAGAAVKVLSQDEISISHTTSRLAEFLEYVIGPLTVSGCNVTKTGGNTYKISINGGTFLVGLSERVITGAVGTPFTYVWQSAPGVWTYNAATIIDKTKYDNGTGPTAFAADDWKKDAVYLIKNSGGEQYFVVMGQTAFTDQAAALAGALPLVPDLLANYGLRVAAIVTHAEDADIDTVVDIRPFLGQNSPVTTAVPVNHNDTLLRDRDDNHTQYHTDARAVTWLSTQPGNTTNLVTDGNDHDHTGGAGAQISHTNLSDIGTTTHANLDLFVGSKAAASGLASLNGSSKVVQDPANATATPTAGKIPLADGAALLDGWVSSGAAAATASLRKIGTGALEACAGDDVRLSNARTPSSTLAHQASHISGTDQLPVATTSVKGLMSDADKLKLDNLGTQVTAVTGTAPIVSSGGTTPAISISAASGLAPGSMSAAHYTKLEGIAAGATANIFGNGYQTAISTGRSTYNTNTSFQNKVTLTTAALPAGTYRVSWTAVLDNSATNQNVEAQLYNTTDVAIVGVVQVMRPANAAERRVVSGFSEAVFAGVAKTFNIQYRTANTGATVGIADARIEIWRVA